jgi:hypothetical protein
MRIALCLFAALLSGFASSQVWEKLVAPGLTYRMEADLQTPRVLHAIRWTPGAPGLRANPEVAHQSALSANPNGGRQTLSALVAQAGALAGVNADFFPARADPLGIMVRNGELISHPWRGRAGFAWGPGGAMGGLFDWSGQVFLPDGTAVPIHGINKECSDGELVLKTDDAGQAIAERPNVLVRLASPGVDWRPGSDLTATVAAVLPDAPVTPIAAGEAFLLARGAPGAAISGLQPGDTIRVRLELTGFDLSKMDQAVGGGPMLVREGQPAIDWQTAGFGEGFANNRHPRTAVGRTQDGDLWFVVVDGRQSMSVGATLLEMAQIMIRLGCVEAVNLDGGGSSTIAVHGVTLNRPSDGQERAIANAVLLFGPTTWTQPEDLVIQGPPRLAAGAEAVYRAIGPDGRPVPVRDVLWSAMGAAWIDQGGTLRGLRQGEATIRASVRGRIATVTVQVFTP